MPAPALATSMLAARFVGGGRIQFQDQPVPEPGPGQLLLKVTANALCGSDRHQLERGADVVPGHEVAGMVVVGGSGTVSPVGTHGVAYLMEFCGACRCCRVGATNQCGAKRADLGFTRDGGYAPFTLVAETAFFPTPGLEGAPATLLLDVMGTAGHALRRATRLHADVERVLVMGAGPLGLAALVMTRLLLGDDVPVAVADASRYRLALVEQLGGVAVDLNDDCLSDGLLARGFAAPDVAIDTAGRTIAREAALEILAARGVLVCVGHGEGLCLQVTPSLIAPERAVVGSEYFRYDELPANLELLHEHGDLLGRLITHRLPAEQLPEAFDLFLAGQTGKVVVEHP